MTDMPEAFDDDAWWDAVLNDPRVRCRPDDPEDGFFGEDDPTDWEKEPVTWI